nr:O-succinylhomoserine sulfhydrylase [Rhodococcus sp. (in: high G+C Gram-positive bacteria)]
MNHHEPQNSLKPATIAVRAGNRRTQFSETSEALFLNSGYVYESAEAAEAAFNGEIDRFVYSRYGNPTTAMFEERLRAMEGAEACTATASGMGAVFTSLAALLKPGDRLVAARSLFGSCFVVCNEILPSWGVETVFVDGDDIVQWQNALQHPAAVVFFETPSNPMQTLVDIAAVSALAHEVGATVVVDNGFLPVGMQHGLQHGADVIVHSATKTIDGQGRVMGGAILGSKDFIEGPVRNMVRHTGPTMAPFNAWVLAKGLESSQVRTDFSSRSAAKIADYLSVEDAVEWVRYPYHPSHPQYDLAQRQMSNGGTVITLSLQESTESGKKTAFRLLNRLQLIDISNNFGDAKSLISHPSTTTHRAMGAEARSKIGLNDSVVRLSVGLEDADDLIADLRSALA